MNLGTEARGKMDEMFKSGTELVTSYNNCKSSLDLDGKKTVRYSDGSIEWYDKKGKLKSRVDNSTRIRYEFGRKMMDKILVKDMDSSLRA